MLATIWEIEKLVMKKIIFINIIVTFVIFAIIEIISYINWSLDYDENGRRTILANRFSRTIKPFDEIYNEWKKINLRKPVGENFSKKSILWFGCSFAYGYGLNEEQTGSYKLSMLSKRAVYNRGIPSGSINHMLYQLKDESLYKAIKKEPEYLIYTWIYVQNPRFKYFSKFGSNDQNLQYKLVNGKYTQVKINKCYKYYYPYILRNIQRKLENDSKYPEYEYFEEIFLECMKEIKKHYPNIKFVILEYRSVGKFYEIEEYPKFNRLKEQGVIILDTKDLVKENMNLDIYKLAEFDEHPNEKAWNKIIPELVKKLNL